MPTQALLAPVRRCRPFICAPFALLTLCVGLLSSCTGDLAQNSASTQDMNKQDVSPGVDAVSDTGAGQDIDQQGLDQGEEGSKDDMGEEPEPVVVKPHVNAQDQDDLFTCSDVNAPSASPMRLRRLSQRQYSRAAGENSGSRFDKNPLQDRVEHMFTSYTDEEAIEPSMVDVLLLTTPGASSSWSTQVRQTAARSISEVSGFGKVETKEGLSVARVPIEEVTDEMRDAFVAHLLEKGVLHRKPTAGELNRMINFAQKMIDQEAADTQITRVETVEKIVSAAWLMSGALFHLERGSGEVDSHGRRKLQGRELANAIAFSLHGQPASAPGIYYKSHRYTSETDVRYPELLEAAEHGTLSDPSVLAGIIEASLGGHDPERLDDYGEGNMTTGASYWMTVGVKNFFREWLGYEHVSSVFKDTPNATSAFEDEPAVNSSYQKNLLMKYYAFHYPKEYIDQHNPPDDTRKEPSLIEQMDDTIAKVVYEDKEVLKNLLTTTDFYTVSTAGNGGESAKFVKYTNRLYGHTEELVPSREGRWYDVSGDRRAGVLTHPAWLAAHGSNFENGPSAVLRGKWIREDLLCDVPPSLEGVMLNVDLSLTEGSNDQSARQRLVEQTDNNPQCSGCHVQMNPLGYPFEVYNHAGFVRATDHGNAPNGQSILRFVPYDTMGEPQGLYDKEVEDAVEMVTAFSTSTRVKRCFIRQTFRYFMGREENEMDACTLHNMELAYDMSNGSFARMLATLYTSDTFLYRYDEDADDLERP